MSKYASLYLTEFFDKSARLETPIEVNNERVFGAQSGPQSAGQHPNTALGNGLNQAGPMRMPGSPMPTAQQLNPGPVKAIPADLSTAAQGSSNPVQIPKNVPTGPGMIRRFLDTPFKDSVPKLWGGGKGIFNAIAENGKQTMSEIPNVGTSFKNVFNDTAAGIKGLPKQTVGSVATGAGGAIKNTAGKMLNYAVKNPGKTLLSIPAAGVGMIAQENLDKVVPKADESFDASYTDGLINEARNYGINAASGAAGGAAIGNPVLGAALSVPATGVDNIIRAGSGLVGLAEMPFKERSLGEVYDRSNAAISDRRTKGDEIAKQLGFANQQEQADAIRSGKAPNMKGVWTDPNAKTEAAKADDPLHGAKWVNGKWTYPNTVPQAATPPVPAPQAQTVPATPPAPVAQPQPQQGPAPRQYGVTINEPGRGFGAWMKSESGDRFVAQPASAGQAMATQVAGWDQMTPQQRNHELRVRAGQVSRNVDPKTIVDSPENLAMRREQLAAKANTTQATPYGNVTTNVVEDKIPKTASDPQRKLNYS